MISEMLLDVDFVSFSSDFFSSSFTRSEMTFCNCSVLDFFFLNAFGSLETRFLIYDMASSVVVRRDSAAPRFGLVSQDVRVASASSRAIRSSIGGWVEKSAIIPPPVSGLTINIWAVAGRAASIGIA